MLEKQKEIFLTIVVKPIKNNITCVFFFSGFFLILLGSIFNNQIDALPYVPSGFGVVILKSGSAILGAGVFAAIMKSSQFTELFQKHIYDVFYNPEHVGEGRILIEKWRTITNSILQGVLPKTHLDATEKLRVKFFTEELSYHFEQFCASYSMSVDKNTNILTVTAVTRFAAVISPHVNDPVLEQNIENDGDFKLLALRVNDTDIKDKNTYVSNEPNSKKKELKVPLKDYAFLRDDDVKVVRVERVVKYTQDLTRDPYVKAEISRYMKGATIRAKVNEGYKIFFEKFGLDKTPAISQSDDGEGYQRWVLAEPNNLLLPGQGYIMVITPEISTS